MKALAQGVYKGNEKYIPKDWIKVSEFDNSKSGFHGEAFYKDGEIVIALCGTEKEDKKDWQNNIDMGMKKLPNQYVDSQKFYEQIKKDFPDMKIVFTGHSLGGSLAQLMGNKTGCETVTFNAYGVANLLNSNINDNLNIRNYGHIDDTVFNLNLRNQLGNTFIIGYGKGSNNYITKSPNGNYIGGLSPKNHHFIEDMGNLEDAVSYKPDRLEGKISFDIDYKDLDENRVFTNEEISQMSKEEYKRLENFIENQISKGFVLPKAKADEQVKSGDLIWVNAYTRSDGTEVSGYYRQR